MNALLPATLSLDWANRIGFDRYGIYSELELEGVCFTFRWIPSGEFIMGSPDGENGRFNYEPQHRVILSEGYWLLSIAVTESQWVALGGVVKDSKGAGYPVVDVSWEACVKVLDRLNREVGFGGLVARLPTEAEWEYACRAGTDTAFNDGLACTQPDGNDAALDALGWFDKNSDGNLHPVAQKCANSWGLYDMHGNVWEWCHDYWDDFSEVPATARDPEGPAIGRIRVSRGGGFRDSARYCRSAYRVRFHPGYSSPFLGFRFLLGHELQQGGAGK